MVPSQIFFKKEGQRILKEKAFGDMLNLRTNLGAQVEVVCVCARQNGDPHDLQVLVLCPWLYYVMWQKGALWM